MRKSVLRAALAGGRRPGGGHAAAAGPVHGQQPAGDRHRRAGRGPAGGNGHGDQPRTDPPGDHRDRQRGPLPADQPAAGRPTRSRWSCRGSRSSSAHGILLRAAVNFQVDVSDEAGRADRDDHGLGRVADARGQQAGNVLNIDGEFQKNLPLAARKNWTDFLEQTPGVHSRPFDDGSGRMVYFGHATEHFAHVVQLEGMQAGNYNDFQLTYVQMGSDMIQDIQVKTGGSDAATPMGTGLGINVITKSGGNTFRGSAGFAYQPLDWTDDNTHHKTVFTLTAPLATYGNCPQRRVRVHRRHARAGRRQAVRRVVRRPDPEGPDLVLRLVPAVARSRPRSAAPEKNKNDIHGVLPRRRAVPQQIKGYQPYVKITSRARQPATSCRGSSSGTARTARATGTTSSIPINVYSNGGNVYSAQGHVGLELEADDDLLGRLQRQERQRRGHLRGVRLRRAGAEHQHLRRDPDVERATSPGTR